MKLIVLRAFLARFSDFDLCLTNCLELRCILRRLLKDNVAAAVVAARWIVTVFKPAVANNEVTPRPALDM